MVRIRHGRNFEITGVITSFTPGSLEIQFEFENGIELRIPRINRSGFESFINKLRMMNLEKINKSFLDFNTGQILMDLTKKSDKKRSIGGNLNIPFTQGPQGAVDKAKPKKPSNFTQEPQGAIDKLNSEKLDELVNPKNADSKTTETKILMG